MKKSKKFLSLLLTALLVMSLLPTMAWADGEPIMTVDQLNSAITTAGESGTVELIGNVTLTEQLTIDKAITLDGRGFTITRSSTTGNDKTTKAAILVTAGATIKNLTVSGPNTTASGWNEGEYGIKVYNTEGVTLEKVTVTAANAGILVDSSKVTLKDTINVSGNEYGGIEVSKGSDLNKVGALTIAAGATVTCTDETVPAIWIDGTTNEQGIVTNSSDTVLREVKNTGNSNNQIYYWTTGNVAAIGNVGYATLADAIAAVPTDGTSTEIELLKSVTTGGMSVAGGKNFTLDFNNYTLTFDKPGAGSTGTTTQGFQLLTGSTITFKNGTINCTEANKNFTWDTSLSTTQKGIAWIINNYATLTLDNMTIDGTNVAHNGNTVRNVVNNYAGTINVINGSVITATGSDFAINAYYYNKFYTPNETYTAPVTNITASTVNGKVEVVAGRVDLENGTTVNGQVRVGQNGKGGDKATACDAGGVLNIKAGAKVSAPEYAITVWGDNTLNVYGTVESTSETSNDTAAISTNGNAYNAGSKINVYNGAVITSKKCSAIYMPNGALTISGGTITGPTAVYFKSTSLSISGGTLTGSGEKANYTFNGNGGNPTGDALVIDNCNYPSGINAPVITGGTFISTNAKAVGSYAGNGQTAALTGFITGGTFEVKSAEELNTVLGYLGENADVTIKLANDVTGGGIQIDTKKTVTIDFDNHTYTVNAPAVGSTGTKNQAFQILKGQTVTMKNGTIAIAASNKATETTQKISRVIQNYANLTLNNMKFSDENLAWRSESQTAQGTLTSDTMIECDNGTVSLINGTVLTIADANKSSRYALAMEDWPNNGYVDGVQITVDGATINGHVRFYSDKTRTGSDIKSTFTLKTNTLNGKIYDDAEGVTNGKITVPAGYQLIKGNDNSYTVYRPSSGGGSSTPAAKPVEIPAVGGDSNAVKVEAAVSGSTATVKEISTSEISKVGTDAVSMDFSGLDKAVDEVKLPAESVEAIAGSASSGLEIKLSTGTVAFDAAAVEAISEAATGKDIALNVETVDKKELSSAQKSTVEGLGNAVIVKATLTSGGKTISDFGGGSAAVTVPYAKKDAKAVIVVYYLDDSGKLTKMNAAYDAATKSVTFIAPHFSEYVLAEVTALPFVDVAESDYYADAVRWAAENGITSGVDETHFAPTAITTRAQMVTFLWRAAGCPKLLNMTANGPAPSPFKDVATDAYYYDAIVWAVSEGITKGTSDTTFSPDANVSRGQTVTFLARMSGVKDDATGYTHSFADVSAANYYSNAVAWAATNGITSGTSATTFSPNDDCLRGQIVTFLYRNFVK